MTTTTRTALAGTALLALALLAACGEPPAAAPPSTCYVRAKGENAVLAVTGPDAARTCRDFQAWSLKESPSRVLELSEAPPDPATLIPSRFPLTQEQIGAPPEVKQTCSYTLGGTTYAVTDTGGQAIGGGWCKHFYTLSVQAQAAADKRAPR